jgi:hypothetical protein
MLKRIDCLRRKPDMSVEEFPRCWREVPASVGAERAEILGVKRYIHAHTALPDVIPALPGRNGGSPSPTTASPRSGSRRSTR